MSVYDLRKKSVLPPVQINDKPSLGSELVSQMREPILTQSLLYVPSTKPADMVQLKQNNTGLPDQLKAGVEQLSGYSLEDVRVHYNSERPAQLQAHAFAQGSEIHVAPGQEQHLPHEAWHVIQQKQGRVHPTIQLNGQVGVNDDVRLEREADVMGNKAIVNQNVDVSNKYKMVSSNNSVVQKVLYVGREKIKSWEEIINLSPSNDDRKIIRSVWASQSEKVIEINKSLRIPPYVIKFKDFNTLLDSLITKDDLAKQAAEDNHTFKPYTTDALFEKDDIMMALSSLKSGQRKFTDSTKETSLANTLGLVGGIAEMGLGLGKILFNLGKPKNLFNKHKDNHEKIRIVSAVALSNPDLMIGYEKAKQKMKSAGININEKDLYSGHRREIMELIKKTGHHPGKTPYDSGKGFGAMGAGTYLTDTVDKAVAYAKGNKINNGFDSILQYKVLLGNAETIYGKELRHETNDDLVDREFWPAEKHKEIYYESQSKKPRVVKSAFDSRISSPDPDHTPGFGLLNMALDYAKPSLGNFLKNADLPSLKRKPQQDTFDSAEYLIRNPMQILPVAEIFFETPEPFSIRGKIIDIIDTG